MAAMSTTTAAIARRTTTLIGTLITTRNPRITPPGAIPAPTSGVPAPLDAIHPSATLLKPQSLPCTPSRSTSHPRIRTSRTTPLLSSRPRTIRDRIRIRNWVS